MQDSLLRVHPLLSSLAYEGEGVRFPPKTTVRGTKPPHSCVSTPLLSSLVYENVRFTPKTTVSRHKIATRLRVHTTFEQFRVWERASAGENDRFAPGKNETGKQGS